MKKEILRQFENGKWQEVNPNAYFKIKGKAILELLNQEKAKSFKDGKLNGFLEACQEMGQRIKKVGGR